MITRGIIIGKIIDYLSDLQNRIDFRCQLGLTDLNKYCEDFIKEVLNICLDLNLQNLNAERSNEAGLDLGDKAKTIAFQVSSVGTSQKVNHTLDRITAAQLVDFPKIRMIILGKKQGTYDAVDRALMEKCGFDPYKDILDISDVCRHMIALKYDDLYTLFQLFEKEFQIVLTEIEVPNKDGEYPTQLSDKLEVIPNTICANGLEVINEFPDATLEEVRTEFRNLGQLPRVTREFLEIIIKIGENRGGNFSVDYPELRRKLRMPEKEIREEISILENRGFVWGPDEENSNVRTRFSDVLITIVDLGVRNNSLKKLIVALDFTLLDQ